MTNKLDQDEQRALEKIAKKAADTPLKAEMAGLTKAEKANVAFLASPAKAWAIFEWYIPGKTQADARIILRIIVNKATRKVLLARRPPLSRLPIPKTKLTALAVLAPLLVAGAALATDTVFRLSAAAVFPLIEFAVWAVAQLLILAVIFIAMSHFIVLLPDGERVVVVRQCTD
ncbi:MAG TPA: hypothetical protein VG735_06115 [Caulobacterales bacterium]|nr:hypothetical protein [Caulobacterales bacterium]